MKKKIIFLGAIIALVMATWAIIRYRMQPTPTHTDAIWVEAAKVQEVVVPLETHAMGSLTARSVEITPEVAGQVREIFFVDGSFVKQNTPLYQLDDAIYEAKYRSSKAQLNYSQNDYNRKSLLGKQGVVTKQAIDQAEADLKEKTATVQTDAVMVNKMKLIAPFDGMVGKSKVNLGDYVTTGQSLVTLTDTKHLRIEYTVPEQYLPSLKLGQEVIFTTAAYPEKTFSGRVSFISPTININDRSISLYAEVTNENNLLMPGMFVDVKQSLGTQKHVLMVPSRSLVPMLDGEQVYKLVNGKAYSVSVSIGKRTSENVQVLQGLSLGDEVVTDGQLKIKNGMDVQIYKAKNEPT